MVDAELPNMEDQEEEETVGTGGGKFAEKAKEARKELGAYATEKDMKFRKFFAEELNDREQVVAWKIYKKWDKY